MSLSESTKKRSLAGLGVLASLAAVDCTRSAFQAGGEYVERCEQAHQLLDESAAREDGYIAAQKKLRDDLRVCLSQIDEDKEVLNEAKQAISIAAEAVSIATEQLKICIDSDIPLENRP